MGLGNADYTAKYNKFARKSLLHRQIYKNVRNAKYFWCVIIILPCCKPVVGLLKGTILNYCRFYAATAK